MPVRAWSVEVACPRSVITWSCTGFVGLLLLYALDFLLNELPGDDTKDFFDALSVLGADLMAAVPSNVLTPEATASLAVQRLYSAHTASSRWCS